MHEWTNVEFKAICRKQSLSVRGAKGELMERVKVHFQQLYRLYRVCYELCHCRWNIWVAERCVTAIHEESLVRFMFNCAGCRVGFECYH